MADKFEYKDFTYRNYQESDAVKAAQAALSAQLAQKPGAYQSQWQTQIDDTLKKIQNKEKFSYDVNGDALYQQYKDKYTQQGKMAMQDTMGQAAALTGGYGNSYAATVGNQAYQASMQELNNVIPELYQMAYNRHQDEKQDLYNQYALLGERENMDYGKYRDTVSDFNVERDYLTGRYDSERNYDYSKYSDNRNFSYGKYSDDKSYAYNEHRNAIADKQWQTEFEEAKRQYETSLAEQKRQYDLSYELSKQKSTPGGVDPEPTLDASEATNYSDWDAGDWEGYFASIRQSEGADAAKTELKYFTDKGLIPKKMLSYASIGARGSLGH